MLNLAIVIAVFAALAWLFVAITKQFAEQELSFWTALGILAVAKMASRYLSLLVPDSDITPPAGVKLAIYFVVVTGGLIAVAKVRPLIALGIALAVSIAAIVVPVIFVMTGIV